MTEKNRRQLRILLGTLCMGYLPMLELFNTLDLCKMLTSPLLEQVGWPWGLSVGLVPLTVIALLFGISSRPGEALIILFPLIALALMRHAGPLAAAAPGVAVGQLLRLGRRRERSAEVSAVRELLLILGAILAMSSSLLLFGSGLHPLPGTVLLVAAPIAWAVILHFAGRALTLVSSVVVAIPIAAFAALFSLQGWVLGGALQRLAGEGQDDPWPEPAGRGMAFLAMWLVTVFVLLTGQARSRWAARASQPTPPPPPLR